MAVMRCNAATHGRPAGQDLRMSQTWGSCGTSGVNTSCGLVLLVIDIADGTCTASRCTEELWRVQRTLLLNKHLSFQVAFFLVDSV